MNRGTGRSEYYAPEMVASLKKVREITERGRELIRAHYNSDFRVRTVSVRLLEFHALYADMLADMLIAKASGDDEGAVELMEKMKAECGKYELMFERWYDHGLYFFFIQLLAKTKTEISDRAALGTEN